MQQKNQLRLADPNQETLTIVDLRLALESFCRAHAQEISKPKVRASKKKGYRHAIQGATDFANYLAAIIAKKQEIKETGTKDKPSDTGPGS